MITNPWAMYCFGVLTGAFIGFLFHCFSGRVPNHESGNIPLQSLGQPMSADEYSQQLVKRPRRTMRD